MFHVKHRFFIYFLLKKPTAKKDRRTQKVFSYVLWVLVCAGEGKTEGEKKRGGGFAVREGGKALQQKNTAQRGGMPSRSHLVSRETLYFA